MTRLSAEGLEVVRDSHKLLANVHCALRGGELLGVCGPNGAGKSTLLRALCGLDAAAAGRVTLDGEPIATLSPRLRARRIAYLPQGPQVVWPLTVTELVALGRFPHHRRWPQLAREDRDAVADAMRRTALTALAGRDVTSLSGGERMRVHIARLLAGGGAVVLADEPTASLDPRFQLEILALLRQLAADGVAVGVVLHDLVLASRYCSRVLVLAHGRVVADGAPRTVLNDALLAEVFGVGGEWHADGVLLGLRPSAAAHPDPSDTLTR
jgi:iron complex transport system ATP-binding protein